MTESDAYSAETVALALISSRRMKLTEVAYFLLKRQSQLAKCDVSQVINSLLQKKKIELWFSGRHMTIIHVSRKS